MSKSYCGRIGVELELFILFFCNTGTSSSFFIGHMGDEKSLEGGLINSPINSPFKFCILVS